ncbi:MAG: Abi-alpha family protein [Alphaproteobacteria bacterium]
MAIPLMRAAYDESRPELQEIWARLIAAAMDPQRAPRVRISFIETVKRMDPLDALVLQKLAQQQGNLSPNARDFLAAQLEETQEEIMLSAGNLVDCKCIGWKHNAVNSPDFYISDYGRALIRACS